MFVVVVLQECHTAGAKFIARPMQPGKKLDLMCSRHG